MSSVGEGEDDVGKANMKKRCGQRNKNPRKSQRDLGGPFWSLLTLGCTLESSGMLNKKINSDASSQASLVRAQGWDLGIVFTKAPYSTQMCSEG